MNKYKRMLNGNLCYDTVNGAPDGDSLFRHKKYILAASVKVSIGSDGKTKSWVEKYVSYCVNHFSESAPWSISWNIIGVK